MLYTVCQNKKKWVTFCPDEGAIEYDPETIHTFFMDILEAQTEGGYVFIRHLDNYFIDILRLYRAYGFTDTTKEALSVKKMPPQSYSYIVSDDGQCFSITLKVSKNAIIYIRTFDRLIPIKKERELLETYGIKDYGLCSIAEAMYAAIIDISSMIPSTRLPLTLSSLSYQAWQSCYSPYDFYSMFRNANKISVFDMSLEEYLRPAYHGGWCYLNYDKPRKYKDHKGCTLDVNSLYPYIMENMPLPYGTPFTFTGAIPDVVQRMSKAGFIYYYIRVKAKFRIKPGHFPCIQIGGSAIYYADKWVETTEPLDNIDLDDPILTLTMTDYELLKEHYIIERLEIIDGVYFRSTTKMFRSFIDRFYSMKEHAKTKGERKIAKMIMNSLSGNMAKRMNRTNMLVDPDKSGSDIFIDKVLSDSNKRAMSHIQIGAAITSYARSFIVGYAHKFAKYFCYCDTDSLHLDINYRLLDIPIGSQLGEFKIEGEWDEAVFYSPKVYAERSNDKRYSAFKCSGLDSEVNDMIGEMLRNGHPKHPEGVDEATFLKLRVKLIVGIDALEKIRIPYTEKQYKNFTYTNHLHEFKIKFEKKQKKMYKIV